jgi:hypothetical protein
LQQLQRADLILPEHPVVLREMALAHQKMGETQKAQQLFERSNAAASRAPASTLSPVDAGAESAPPPVLGPVSFGRSKVARDMTCTTGEKQILRLELRASPGAVINPDNINIDVFFYDLVDGTRVEQSKCDKPGWKFALPVDFSEGGKELVDVTYHMPRMTEAEVKEHGRRMYHGFVAKLYYEGRFLGDTAEPRSLLSQAATAVQP